MLTDLTESSFWTRETIDELVRVNEGVVLMLTKSSCDVADAVEPKLEKVLSERFPRMHYVPVYVEHAPELLRDLQVVASPTVIVWFDGKETARFVRSFSLEAVADAIARPYGLMFS